MMRRTAGPALVGAGVFLVVLAILLPTVVYPRLAVLPFDPQGGQTVHGTGFTVFVPRSDEEGGLKVYRDAAVSSRLWAVEEPGFDRGSGDAVNYRIATTTTVDGVGLLSAQVEGVSLDRRTTLASNCCRDYLVTAYDDTTGTPLRHVGYVATFPFDTQRRDYPFWDVNIRATEPARYAGEEHRHGLDLYRFEQTVPDRKIGTQDLPGSVFGLPDPSVTADSRYTTRRTYWVEPSSGSVVDYRETMDRRFVYRDHVLPVVQGTAAMDDSPENAKILDTARNAARTLPLIHRTLSLVLAPLGLACLVAGLVLLGRRHRHRDDDDADLPERTLTGAGA